MTYTLTEPQSTNCLISDREAAKMLGCSTRHVYTLRQRGDLAYVRVGQLVRFRLADIESYITKSTVNAGATHVE